MKLNWITWSFLAMIGVSVFNILQIGINTPREVLYERINTRVDEMIKEGLVDEI